MTALATSLARIFAVFMKEIVQMRRDRLTAGMLFGIPIVQLILFGYAINMDPRRLPAAMIMEEQSPAARSIIKALENSGYYEFVIQTDDPRDSETLLARGEVAFVVTIPTGFTRLLVRGERPQILIEADASDPVAASNAIGHARTIIASAITAHLKGSLGGLAARPDAVEVIVHPRYNPEGKTSYHIVPGLLGVILTMTLVMITSIAMTRETEQGTMENLLAMPASPVEVMLGKILPYVFVGAGQTILILVAAYFLFSVPFAGNFAVLALGVAIFVLANLSVGFTFSTIAKTQMQAMQMTIFFFLPSILLTGFMFPFRGMPDWAQGIGEALPLTHFLRVVRGVMLKGADLSDLSSPLLALCAFTACAMTIALLRYRRTLD